MEWVNSFTIGLTLGLTTLYVYINGMNNFNKSILSAIAFYVGCALLYLVVFGTKDLL